MAANLGSRNGLNVGLLICLLGDIGVGTHALAGLGGGSALTQVKVELDLYSPPPSQIACNTVQLCFQLRRKVRRR